MINIKHFGRAAALGLAVSIAITPMLANDAVAQSAKNRSKAKVLDLETLANPNSSYYNDRAVFTVEGARSQVIESAARGVGIRGGFAAEAQRINDLLMQRYRTSLEAKYDFKHLMLNDGYVVPPAISKIEKVQELSGPNYLYLTDGSYEIVREPRLTTIAPTWMDWLLLPIREIRPPENIGLKGGDEKRLWGTSVRRGWATGVREARLTFTTAIQTLNRDYGGMELYHQMADAGMLSVPKVDITKVPWRITSDGKRAFEGETIVEIKVGSKFRLKRRK